ncbi:hypothetical protein BLOT_001143 [Blomia tropicalis]|nr:hypothetical protein BLOT_001143 [Blomia tropicalis]
MSGYPPLYGTRGMAWHVVMHAWITGRTPGVAFVGRRECGRRIGHCPLAWFTKWNQMENALTTIEKK